ncbi:craniofacial development protein 2-like [Octopus sinensis]|uniref:Craniofacial development protein 2-like n=1 Tax=Octopus sinensis TaxID=2607531 RepID=A0A6P7T869_9MOLL|nr:craniofacial development protein 2-like [Octopus sinensis]
MSIGKHSLEPFFQMQNAAVPPPHVISCLPIHSLGVATVNVSTLKGRSGEIVEMLEWRRVDVCCFQEVRWQESSAKFLTGKRHRYKLFWEGNGDGEEGLGILLAEKWVNKVTKVDGVCDRVHKLRLVLQSCTATIISAYAPHPGLLNKQKDPFYDILLQATSKMNYSDLIFVVGDFNRHVGQHPGVFHGVHRSHGIGSRNEEGTRLLEFCYANDLMICNTNFRKPASHKPGDYISQVNYILTRKSNP